MKVILLKDIEKIGKKFEVVEVADGHARNFLIPKKLAEPASKEALEKVRVLREAEQKQAEQELVNIQGMASKLDGQEIEIKAKVKEDGELFGSVGIPTIVEELAKQGIVVDKKWIKLVEPIKEVGEYEVPFELEHGLEVKVRVIVAEEKEKEGQKEVQ